MRKASLYFCQGSSDKVYEAIQRPVEGGFLVEFAYGRRGSTLTTGTKTPTPVSAEQAAKIFDKLVAEKKSKGYTEQEGGAAYEGTPTGERVSGLLPMLLNPVDEASVKRLLADPDWCVQVKMDGERRMVMRDREQTSGINRKGLFVALSTAVADALRSLPFEHIVIDGEAIGEKLFAFDLLELDQRDLRSLAYSQRFSLLSDVLRVLQSNAISLVRAATGDQRHEAVLAARGANEEGIVLKRLSGRYVVGAPASGGDALKFKFVESATCQVRAVSTSKRSVELQVFDGDVAVPVGNVTIPPNHEVPAVGAIVEVRYLYAYPNGGSLFQPIYLGRRSDQEAVDCQLAKLKFKPTLASAA